MIPKEVFLLLVSVRMAIAGYHDGSVSRDYNQWQQVNKNIESTDAATVPPQEHNCANDTFIIETILGSSEAGTKVYNKHKLPNPKGVDIRVEVWIQAITTVSEITSDFELDMYISELWIDPALRYAHLNPCKLNLSLTDQVLQRLWTPNNVFVDSKNAKIHESPFRNVFLMIYPNGTVWVNYRIKVTGPCVMNLEAFPMDVVSEWDTPQDRFDVTHVVHAFVATMLTGYEFVCSSLTYESFTYNTDVVRLRWMPIPEPVSKLRELKLPDYDLVSIEAVHVPQDFPAGRWDDLKMIFTFKRRSMWYIMQAYLPTYLTIFISWIAFAIGTKAMPARTLLGVNALLAMIFQFGNIMRNLPRVSYVKAIDVWMIAGTTYVFASLLELAAVGYLTKDPPPPPPPSPENDDQLSRSSPTQMICNKHCEEKKTQSLMQSPCMVSCSLNSHTVTNVVGQANRRFGVGKLQVRLLIWYRRFRGFFAGPVTADYIDKMSSVFFPLSFLIFNIIYWTVYMI